MMLIYECDFTYVCTFRFSSDFNWTNNSNVLLIYGDGGIICDEKPFCMGIGLYRINVCKVFSENY